LSKPRTVQKFDCAVPVNAATLLGQLKRLVIEIQDHIGEAIPVEMVQLHSELHTAFFWLIFVRKFNEPEPGGVK